MDMEGVVVVSAQFDTTIYVDGQDQGGEFGSQDTMLVQGGDPGDNDLPRAYSLVQFELDGTEVDMLMEPVEAEFCLTHVINEGSADRIVTYTTCAVPFDSNVNNLTGSTATYILPDDCLSGETVEFDLSPTSDLVCIGVRGLLMSLTGTGGGNETTARLRGRWRQLQDDRLLQVGGPDLQDELMLPEGPVVMAIYLSGDSTESGDRFYTSNDVEGRGPELNFVSMADTPTMIPSSNMTLGPYEPCNICGGDLSVSLPDAVITVDDEMGQVTCATLEAACFGGYCESTQCNTLIQLTGDLCGCAAADSTENPDATDPPTIPEPNNDPCNICGVGLNVTIPDGIVPELDGQTCETVALACFSGFCNATVCELLPVVAQEPCGCSGGDIEV
jgi:hypothetical protein